MQTITQMGATPAPESQSGATQAQAQQSAPSVSRQQTAGTPSTRFSDWASI
ncbi:hypothetical protein [Phaeovulum sp.]|uniref:hypothetical protein n=1 Tax=Phaeovulum sp. TaxID=2934796 RepID=UPI00356994ED